MTNISLFNVAACLNIQARRIKEIITKDRKVKMNDKIQCFGVVIPPLSRKIYQIMQITAFKAILARRIKVNIQGCEDYENTFTRMESDCTLRFGLITKDEN